MSNRLIIQGLLAILLFLGGRASAYGQVLVSEVPGAHGDNVNIRISNSQAAQTTNDRRSVIWLDNDGKMKFRNVAGYGFSFRDSGNNNDLVYVANNGNTGFGVPNPTSRIQMAEGSFITMGRHTNANATSGIVFTGFRDVQPNYFGASIEASPNWVCCNGFPSSGYAGIKGISLNFYVHGNNEVANSKQLAMMIHGNGNVGIGTTNPTAKLAVNGNILAKEVKVKTDITVPDYVFEEGYELPDLKELEAYVKQNKHLPEVPSAAEIERDGLDLAAMNLLLLKKVEELTLWMMAQRKETEVLKASNERLEAIVLARPAEGARQ